jgi:hypothetical protein
MASHVQFVEPLATPFIRGETLSIKITHETYVRGVEACKFNLRGRLILNKVDKPYSSNDIVAKLQKLWKTVGQWDMTPLGRGYYEFSFATYDDFRVVWALGTVNLKSWVMGVFKWTKDFNART